MRTTSTFGQNESTSCGRQMQATSTNKYTRKPNPVELLRYVHSASNHCVCLAPCLAPIRAMHSIDHNTWANESVIGNGNMS